MSNRTSSFRVRKPSEIRTNLLKLLGGLTLGFASGYYLVNQAKAYETNRVPLSFEQWVQVALSVAGLLSGAWYFSRQLNQRISLQLTTTESGDMRNTVSFGATSGSELLVIKEAKELLAGSFVLLSGCAFAALAGIFSILWGG